jgi:SAM-dependent methyltransferase
MAKEYPQATFIGIDMSPIFPDVKDTPPNVVFLQLNLNDGIPFPNETFDFVFQRFLCNCVVYEKWEFYVKEMIRVTIPGKVIFFFLKKKKSK